MKMRANVLFPYGRYLFSAGKDYVKIACVRAYVRMWDVCVGA